MRVFYRVCGWVGGWVWVWVWVCVYAKKCQSSSVLYDVRAGLHRLFLS